MTERVPLVIAVGRKKELPAGDTLTPAAMMVRQSVASGETLTVPVGYSLVVAGDYSVIGDLIINGDMRVM